MENINYLKTEYPDWTVEEIAKELAHDYEIVQNANKDTRVHVEKDVLFFCFASKLKDWAESKLKHDNLTATITTTIPVMKAADDLYNPCTNCPNNKGPGTVCYCTLASPKVTC